MRYFDISLPLSPDLPQYPGDPEIKFSAAHSLKNGDTENVTSLQITTHSGTHIDVGKHIRDDLATSDTLPFELLIGTVLVSEITSEKSIGIKELKELPLSQYKRIIFKTRNSQLWEVKGFQKDYVALTTGAAEYLIEKGIKLVGIDYLSIEEFNGNGAVHKTLLENDVVILEGVNMSQVPAGEYQLICLPLKIKGGDGAPVRALLLDGFD
ncbi:MAG: cyclase family protein [Desulfuromonadales bacterium]|nr:cyclase family protein [Desulfuromonadales bacterium]